VNADAILDGEIVKLDADGRPQFYDLMRRRGPFALVAFDVLVLNGKDVRALPLGLHSIAAALLTKQRKFRQVLRPQNLDAQWPG